MNEGQILHLTNYLKLLPYNEWIGMGKFGSGEKQYMFDKILPFQKGIHGYMFETNGTTEDKSTITKIRKICLCTMNKPKGKCNRCGAYWM